jgi:hypothetical protein
MSVTHSQHRAKTVCASVPNKLDCYIEAVASAGVPTLEVSRGQCCR